MSATEVKTFGSDQNCPKPSETCPVCENYSGLDLINNICEISNVYILTIDNPPISVMNNTSLCGKASINKVHLGKPHLSGDFFYSLKPECTCEPITETLAKVTSKVIVLERKADLTNYKDGYPFNNKVNLIAFNDDNEFDIQNLLKNCEEK